MSTGLTQIDFNIGERGNRPPFVMAGCVEGDDGVTKRFWMQADLAANPGWQRGGDFVDVDAQCRAIPMHGAWADLEALRGLRDGGIGALGHRPALAAFSVQRHVDRTKIMRIAAPLPSGPGVIGGKHTADEGDDGDARLTIVADAVDVPPAIAVFADAA